MTTDRDKYDLLRVEERTTVPGHFRALLTRNRRIEDGAGGHILVLEQITFRSNVHPVAYGHAGRLTAAKHILQPLLDLGWDVDSLVVTGYGSKDA